MTIAWSCSVDELISDHHAVHCTLQCTKPHPEKKTVKFRKIKSIDANDLVKNVAESDLCTEPIENHSDLGKLVNKYQSDLTKILDLLAPIKTKSFVERPLIPWVNPEIIKSKRQKRKLEKTLA